MHMIQFVSHVFQNRPIEKCWNWYIRRQFLIVLTDQNCRKLLLLQTLQIQYYFSANCTVPVTVNHSSRCIWNHSKKLFMAPWPCDTMEPLHTVGQGPIVSSHVLISWNNTSQSAFYFWWRSKICFFSCSKHGHGASEEGANLKVRVLKK